MATLISEKEDLYRQEATLRTDYDKSVHNNSELESLMDQKDIDLHSARIEVEDGISIRKFQETDLQDIKKSFNRKITEKIEMGGKLEEAQFALKRANADLLEVDRELQMGEADIRYRSRVLEGVNLQARDIIAQQNILEARSLSYDQQISCLVNIFCRKNFRKRQ
jgi:hypothetical protein